MHYISMFVTCYMYRCERPIETQEMYDIHTNLDMYLNAWVERCSISKQVALFLLFIYVFVEWDDK